MKICPNTCIECKAGYIKYMKWPTEDVVRNYSHSVSTVFHINKVVHRTTETHLLILQGKCEICTRFMQRCLKGSVSRCNTGFISDFDDGHNLAIGKH